MFKELAKHLSKLKVTITIQESKTPGEIIVSVLPTIKNGEKDVNKAIPPFTVKGTPEELDLKFAELFESAADFVISKATDMDKWKKQVTEATAKSEGAKKLKEAEDKKKTAAKEKAKKDIELGDSQFKEKKYDNAKLYYRQALATMGGKDSGLEKKIAECEKLSGNVGLFGGATPSTETTATTDEDNSNTEPEEELDEESSEDDSNTDTSSDD